MGPILAKNHSSRPMQASVSGVLVEMVTIDTTGPADERDYQRVNDDTRCRSLTIGVVTIALALVFLADCLEIQLKIIMSAMT